MILFSSTRKLDVYVFVANMAAAHVNSERIKIADSLVVSFVNRKIMLHWRNNFEFTILKNLYPQTDGYVGTVKRKRTQCKDVRNRSIIGLYNKLHEVVGLLADLLSIQTLTDTTVLQLSTLGVAPFFVENVSELQLSALRLVTKVL